MHSDFIKGKIDGGVIVKEGNFDRIVDKLNEVIDKVNILEAQMKGMDSVKVEPNIKEEVEMPNKVLMFLKSNWWDLVPTVGFIAIAIKEGEGSFYWLGGVLAIVWIFTQMIRIFTKGMTL